MSSSVLPMVEVELDINSFPNACRSTHDECMRGTDVGAFDNPVPGKWATRGGAAGANHRPPGERVHLANRQGEDRIVPVRPLAAKAIL
jgi:hypothetical protein